MKYSNINEVKRIFLLLSALMILCSSSFGQNNLPLVFSKDQNNDNIASVLNLKALQAFEVLYTPYSKSSWFNERDKLKAEIIKKAKVSFYHDLPLDYRETGTIKQKGYTIKKIYFQTRPNVYATANLFVPDGEGPFPGVVTMMGHTSTGKLAKRYQSIGHTLAQNGYVSLNIDPWGAGERGRKIKKGKFEYHGSNMGASLMNVGETLMGLQITDNMRAVDLLTSLPFVDSDKIGATGASGGGNQTMWLAAIDERVKVAVPVVSVGTFQSYIMGSNCVCEMLVDGLTFVEESSVLGLIAPRALNIFNAKKDSNKAFYEKEMLRSYQGAQIIYDYYNAKDKITYEVFDTPHGYFPVMRESLLGWFDLHLKNKGDGKPKKEKPFDVLPEKDLMVFEEGERPSEVVTTADFCYNQGLKLKEEILTTKRINVEDKKNGLRKILKAPDIKLIKTHKLADSRNWGRYILELSSGGMIPVLTYLPNKNSKEYVIMTSSTGKISIPEESIKDIIKQNKGLCIVDLWGIGESISIEAHQKEKRLPPFHTLSRSAIWLGTTSLGIWTSQFGVVSNWLVSTFDIEKITINSDKETALAGLFYATLNNDVKINGLVLREMPLSYLYDKSLGFDSPVSMAIHLPDFLKWGDVSLVAAISNQDITVINPTSISSRVLNKSEVEIYLSEFKRLKSLTNSQSNFHITNKIH